MIGQILYKIILYGNIFTIISDEQLYYIILRVSGFVTDMIYTNRLFRDRQVFL